MRRTTTAAAAVLALGLGACGSSSTSGPEGGQAKAQGKVSCARVAKPVREAISTGLEHGLRLGPAEGVKVGSVYVVAADLSGPGLEGDDDLARFVVGSVREPGYVYAADAVADEFTDWGNRVPEGLDTGAADGCL